MINGKRIIILASFAITNYANAGYFESPISERIHSDSTPLREECRRNFPSANKQITYDFYLPKSVANKCAFLEPTDSAFKSKENVERRIKISVLNFFEKIGIKGVNTEFKKGLRFTFKNKSITLGKNIRLGYTMLKDKVSLECEAKPLGILDGNYSVGCKGVFYF